MFSTLTFSNNVLTVTGTGQSDTITVNQDTRGNIFVRNTTQTARGQVTTGALRTGTGQSMFRNVQSVVVNGAGGNDTLITKLTAARHPGVAVTLNGGAGDDTLRNSGNLAITGNGGAGNDMLFGGAQADTLNGDGNNDVLVGHGGADTLNGGDGRDLLIGDSPQRTNAARDQLVAHLANLRHNIPRGQAIPRAQLRSLRADVAKIQQGVGATRSSSGRAGNDTVNGGAQNDVLIGMNGNDILTGGTGCDLHLGNRGVDTINAGGDDYVDFVNGGPSSDTINVETNDTFRQSDGTINAAGVANNTCDPLFALLGSDTQQNQETAFVAFTNQSDLGTIKYVEINPELLVAQRVDTERNENWGEEWAANAARPHVVNNDATEPATPITISRPTPARDRLFSAALTELKLDLMKFLG